MDVYRNGAICTKIRLWKHKQIIVDIVDSLVDKGYEFKELVYGEPNDFVFTDDYTMIIPTLKKKGGFIGIRLKFQLDNNVIEISCNTNGVDNVKYDIYAETEETLTAIEATVLSLKEIIRPSNNGISLVNEYLANNPNITKIIIAVLVVIVLYFLGVHVLLLGIISIIFSISPFLLLFIIYLIYANRRR